MASDNPVALCHPLPYGRRAAPSKEDDGALEGKTDDYATPAQDYAVTSGRWDRSPPSPSVLCGHPRRPQHHPGHCITIPNTMGGGQQDAATSAAVRPTASRQPHPRAYVRATTKRATPTTPPSKLLLDGYRARHDAPPDARFARTAVYSTTLYTMPLHVDKTVWHACKLPPPWPIKGGAVSQPQGEDEQRSLARFPPSPRYLHLTQLVPLGPGGSACSPASLVAPLCKHYGATQYSAPSTPLLHVRPRPEPV
jgi:hypothetical protein